MLEQHCPQVEVLQTYQSSVEALRGIRTLQPDLLFLDIKMLNIDGLQFLNILGTDSYNAIFVTAYDEYMLQALRLNAFDYLKKPLTDMELKQAIARIPLNRKVSPNQIKKALEHADQGFKINQNTPFGIKEGNRIQFEKIADISYCKSDGNFTYVFLSGGDKLHSSYPLGVMEEKLPEKYFFRCHREYLINGFCIKQYDKADGGNITIKNGKNIPISRSRRDDFLNFMETFS